MTEIDGSIDTVRRLVELVVEHDLAEIEVEIDGQKIMVKGVSSPVTAQPIVHQVVGAVAHAPAHSAPAAQPTKAAQPAARTNQIKLESPMVGVFYRSASPEDPPYVDVGDVVKAGQTIGLIEAMKVYSEVPADHSGRIVEIPAKNGALVQQGEALMYLEPL